MRKSDSRKKRKGTKEGEGLGLCDRVYSLKLGKVFFQGTPADLHADPTQLKQLFL